MKRISQIGMGVFLGAVVWAIPITAAAQQCPLRLSEFEAATVAYGEDVSSFSERLEAMFADFSRLEGVAARAPDECPEGLDNSRAGAAALDLEGLNNRSEQLLDCGYFFRQRVLTDIETARQTNDSQMILRLGQVQQRIFNIDQDATDAIKQATFLGFRAQALVAEHDALGDRCAIFGDIYD